jgi:hypothetical protein
MRKLIGVILVLTLVGCSRQHEVVTVQEDEYKILLIDGCEYIQIGGGNAKMMAHKGNCCLCAKPVVEK